MKYLFILLVGLIGCSPKPKYLPTVLGNDEGNGAIGAASSDYFFEHCHVEIYDNIKQEIGFFGNQCWVSRKDLKRICESI